MASEKSESYLASSQVISLITKLLDPKRNVYAESFNKILATWKPEMIKAMKLDSHIISQKAWENNDGWFIIYNYLTQKSMQGVTVEAEQVLTSEEAIEIYTDWLEKKKPNEGDLSKNFKSLVVQLYDSKSEYEMHDEKVIKYRETSPKNRSVGVSPPPKHLSPRPNVEREEISDEVPLPDFNNLPSVKKHKSFNLHSINDNLNGKNKRFSVMKIISDDIKHKARDLCFNMAKSLFLDHPK